jgi:hypothetical protein
MTKLLEKDVKFKWSPQCQEAFLTLKKLLITAPVLTQPDIEKPFDVYCDASITGIGAILMQDGEPLSPIEDLSLWHISENNYMNIWAPISFETQHIILRRMARPRG